MFQCPVYDLVRNVEFTGEYQTVTRQGAITVQKKQFQSGAFFVVLVVKPHDFDCSGVERVVGAAGKDFYLEVTHVYRCMSVWTIASVRICVNFYYT